MEFGNHIGDWYVFVFELFASNTVAGSITWSGSRMARRKPSGTASTLQDKLSHTTPRRSKGSDRLRIPAKARTPCILQMGKIIRTLSLAALNLYD